ncbi:unnamed protein product (macronuclear) [Paramecium tetraurelia]|uniref:Myb-like domain-containing protein n=1 Tax=Paramecium tetraurelia TaxID=5888 RepID=A0BSD0_PARTE|nr:uncharacterized protein GSPATT00031678001 [Paramecium tetraurelia]CAK61447.1 unnamed protein product [Paramecium tetraurelia]|eukprot:XP_001428845.1 hypothetical protein (macronuclear) [Paramecium tetraurelia strain d4-2]
MIPPTWNEFLKFISDFQDNELDKPLLSQYIRIPNKCMTSFQIIQYFSSDFQKSKIKRKCKWGDTEKYFLIWCVSKLIVKLQIKFHEVYQCKIFETLSIILGLPEEFLLTKWLGLLNYKLKEQPWQPEEDDLLIKLRQQYSKSKDWLIIALEFIKRSQTVRYPKQIRERFNNVINPNINKNEFNQDEILFIFQQAQNKKKNWAGISKSMPHRTDNQIKNVYNSIIRKISNEIRMKNNDNKVDEQFIVNLIIQKKNYDPKFISQFYGEGGRKKPCIKIEPNSDNSYTSEPQIQGIPIQMVCPYINYSPYQFQNIYCCIPQLYLLPHQKPNAT